MAKIRGFRGIRPERSLAEKVAELPYDVVSSEEARAVAGDNKYSFYHVTKPEIGMEEGIDIYSPEVYEQGCRNLDRFIEEGVLVQDEEPKLYLYTQVMNGRAQTGLLTCVSIDDYLENRIKKHELTRKDKEADRTRHLDILSANTGLVFLIVREDGSKKNIFEEAMKIEPEYDFTSEDGVRHIIRIIEGKDLAQSFINAFDGDILYIADGHHRAASAVSVGVNRREMNPDYSGDEEFNSFMAVIFPHDQLNILPYNRAVKDLNGRSSDEFITEISKNFKITESGEKEPTAIHSISMYLDSKWYTLTPSFDISSDPIESLDVTILQKFVLSPMLGIDDPRTDNRISFIGGIRGTKELEKLVDSDGFRVAFSMYPTTVEQLMEVSDSDGIMPPKSTWFEPKLRSGLVVHRIK